MDSSAYTALCSAVTLQSNKNGFFQQIINSVMASVDDQWLTDFGKLKSNKERIVKCLTDKKLKDQIYQMMDNVQEIFRSKSARMSNSKRLEAENLHKIGKIDKSLTIYTQSIIRAPNAGVDKNVDEGFSLALALWGRSNVLHQLGKINFCLDDIKFCLKEKLPDYLKADAYWKMAECYIHLKQFNHARITLNILLKIMSQDLPSNTIQGWRERIKSKLDELLAYKSDAETGNLSSSSNEQVTNNTNPHLPNTTSKLQLTKSDHAGDHLIAAEPISTGDTLIIEDPYVTCLSTEKYGSHCLHCLRRLQVAIPCSDCSAVAFCSLTCRTKSLSTYHKFECHYLDLLIGSGMSVLCYAALRIVSQANVKYFADIDLENRAEMKLPHSYVHVYNMVAHEDKRSSIDFLHRTLMALFLLAVLKKSGFFLNSKSINDIGAQEILIGCVLLRNMEVLQFNAHEICEPIKSRSTNTIKNFTIGIGLYKSASYFNHGCFPAVCRYFQGTKLIIKSVRPILKGEVVEDNYGPIFTKIKLDERRKNLLSRYWFLCECIACSENWATLKELDETTIIRRRCSHCLTPCIVDINTTTIQCKKCNKQIDCGATLLQIDHLNQQIKPNLDELHNDNISEACRKLDQLDRVLCPPHKIYTEIASKLGQWWMNSQQIHTI